MVRIQDGESRSLFEIDVKVALKKMNKNLDSPGRQKLKRIGDHLIEMNKRRLVKTNHSIMELICSKGLILTGYQVDVEHHLDPNLICDIYAVKAEAVLIIEVETGFTPPSHALDPQRYNKARISSKIARYSAYSDKFALATPRYNNLQIPGVFGKPPRFRAPHEVRKIRRLCAKYYKKPPITTEQIRLANLQSIHVIDVDECETLEMDPEMYMDSVITFERLVSK